MADVKLTVDPATRRDLKILAGPELWDVTIKEAAARAAREALARAREERR